MRIGLPEHGQHGLFQELRLIEGGGDDGHGHASFSHDDGRQIRCPGTAASADFAPVAVPRLRRNDAGGKDRLP